jgi:formamidopyrimidine-DNA glycosylase
MPELPEVEITARRLGVSVSGTTIAVALAPGIATLKTVRPPLSELSGGTVDAVRRVGKMLVVQVGDMALLIHLMSAGRVGLFDRPASPKDRSVRLVLRFDDGRELRLRELARQQSAWAKLMPAAELEQDEMIATLGPDAWPAPPPERFAELVSQPRHLHTLLRDQRTIAGIGRSWVDEILWEVSLSPFRQGADLDAETVERLRVACDEVLGAAIEHYERTIGERLPDKLPMPLKVHARQGTPCPRCGTELAAVHFKEHVTTYCPAEQTGGRELKDRRLSRLLR